eukprot:757467-Hanusia_phi.AAC.1
MQDGSRRVHLTCPRQIRVLDLSSRKIVRKFQGEEREGVGAGEGGDEGGGREAGARKEQGARRVLDFFSGHSNRITDLCMSSDGRWLISASSGPAPALPCPALPSSSLVSLHVRLHHEDLRHPDS